mgnify:CR=1 FL=1
MNTVIRKSALVVASAALFLSPVTVLAADSQTAPKYESSEILSAEVSVLDVDHETREIRVMGIDGQIRTYTVADDVDALATVEAGDVIDVEYQAALAVEMRAPTNDELAEPYLVKTSTDKEGTAMSVTRAVCTVVSFDKAASTIRLKGPAGRVFEVKVAPQHIMTHGIVGKTIVVTFTQGLAVSVAHAD